MRLELFIYSEDDEEVLVPFKIDINAIQGFYPNPNNDSVINILSYGQLFTVKKTHALMNQLNNELN